MALSNDPVLPEQSLPFEIIELIFDHLSESFFDDPRRSHDAAYRRVHATLANCQLVCSLFRDLANRRLFRHLNIYSYCPYDYHLQRLLSLGESTSGGVFQYIRTLSFSLRGLAFEWPSNVRGPPTPPVDVLAMILHKLVETSTSLAIYRLPGSAQMESLHLNLLDDYTRWEDIGSNLQSALKATLQSSSFVERLTLSGLRDIPPSVFDSTKLRHLELFRAGTWDIPELPAEPTQEDGVSIALPPCDSALTTLRTDSSFPLSPTKHQIRNLVITGRPQAQLDCALLARNSLESLHFELDQPRYDPDVLLPPRSSSRVFPSLHKISAQIYTIALNISPTRISFEFNLYDIEAIIHLLDSICTAEQTPVLDELTLEFKLYTSSMAAWDPKQRKECIWAQTPGTLAVLDTYLTGFLKRYFDATRPNERRGTLFNFNIHFILVAQYPAGIAPIAGTVQDEVKYWEENAWPGSTVPLLFQHTLETFPNAVHFIHSYQTDHI